MAAKKEGGEGGRRRMLADFSDTDRFLGHSLVLSQSLRHLWVCLMRLCLKTHPLDVFYWFSTTLAPAFVCVRGYDLTVHSGCNSAFKTC